MIAIETITAVVVIIGDHSVILEVVLGLPPLESSVILEVVWWLTEKCESYKQCVH